MGEGGGKLRWIQSSSLEEEAVLAIVLLLLLSLLQSLIVKEDLKETLSMTVDVVEEEEDSLGLGGRGDKPAQEEETLILSFWTSDVLEQQFWGGRQHRFIISLKYKLFGGNHLEGFTKKVFGKIKKRKLWQRIFLYSLDDLMQFPSNCHIL